jgi:hypothetical protein
MILDGSFGHCSAGSSEKVMSLRLQIYERSDASIIGSIDRLARVHVMHGERRARDSYLERDRRVELKDRLH